jgi:hypothetical protein
VKWHGIRSLDYLYQHTCYTKQFPNEDVDFYFMETNARINFTFERSKWNQIREGAFKNEVIK